MPTLPTSLRTHLPTVALIAIAAFAAWFRIDLVRSGRLPFDSDQAIYALGGLRFLQYGTLSIMMEGQNYAADFPSLYFALVHLVLEPSTKTMRLAMLPSLFLMAGLLILTVQALRPHPGVIVVAATSILFTPSASNDLYLRASTIIILPIIAFLGALACALAIRKRLHTSHMLSPTRYLLLGLCLGLGYYGTPGGLIFVAAFATVFLLSHPLRIHLFASSLTLSQGPLRWLMLGSILWAVLGMAVLLFFHPIVFPTDPHLPWHFLALSGLFHLVALVFLGRQRRRCRSALLRFPALILGLILGMTPVIIYQWFLGLALLDVQLAPEDLKAVWHQIGATVNQGLPILLGWSHNWAQPTNSVPWALKLAYNLGLVALPLGILLWAIPSQPRTLGPLHRMTLQICLATAGIQLLAMGLSSMGAFVIEPRYLLIFPVLLSLLLAVALTQLPWPPRRITALCCGLIVLIVSFSLVSGWDLPSNRVTPGTWNTKRDTRILQALEAKNLRLVSTEFSLEDYWLAYKLQYLSGNRIRFGIRPRPGGQFVRCRESQTAVQHGPPQAYLFLQREEGGPANWVRVHRSDLGLTESFAVGGYYVLHRPLRGTQQ